jgi:threonine/homoserine/homoserine lactone efflux protein
MLHPLFEGMFLGLTVAIVIGPALFALMQTSIKYGIKTGIFLALGIFMSDLTIVVASYFGASQIITNPKNHIVFGCIGGGVLFLLGILTLIRHVPKTEQVEALSEIHVKRPGPIPYFFKGYLLNIANPSLWVFWVTSVIAISSSYGGDRRKVAIFFAGTLLMVFGTDILKCFLANKIRAASNPGIKVWVNRVVGILFMIIGLFVIASSIYEFYFGSGITFPGQHGSL